VPIDEREYILDHAKFLAWERDAFNRLYYGLWIVFLGGFVLSLHVVVYRYSCVALVLVVAFRLLAVAGTAVNFLMQYDAIVYLGAVREKLFYTTMGDVAHAETASEKARIFEPKVKRCEEHLQRIAAAFLLIAFAGSFLVHLP
jgi:hypothetical protein